MEDKNTFSRRENLYSLLLLSFSFCLSLCFLSCSLLISRRLCISHCLQLSLKITDPILCNRVLTLQVVTPVLLRLNRILRRVKLYEHVCDRTDQHNCDKTEHDQEDCHGVAGFRKFLIFDFYFF